MRQPVKFQVAFSAAMVQRAGELFEALSVAARKARCRQAASFRCQQLDTFQAAAAEFAGRRDCRAFSASRYGL